MKYPTAFEHLVKHFHRFQGVGRKTAERLVFDLLDHWDTQAVQSFAQALASLHAHIVQCPECRTSVESLPCPFCSEERRQHKAICIVASSRDVYALESTGLFTGTFHVLGGLLSPLHNRGVEHMGLNQLKHKIEQQSISELILALDSSLEGDATVAFLRDFFISTGVVISRLASGVPVGVTLDFVDKGTLRRAFSGRQLA